MTTFTRPQVAKPGMFGLTVPADVRRLEFDYCNESLLMQGIRPDFLFIGDSITNLWELQAYFGGSGKILINRGIGGDTSTYVRKRFQADALQLQPRIIIMKIGTNDLNWQLAELNDAITDTVCDNIAAMAEEAVQAGITMVICSVLPIWGPTWYMLPEFIARKNRQIVDLNARLQTYCAEKGIIYVDYHSRMVDDNGELPRELADDGVHPHSAGYLIMANTLRETLAQHGITL